MVEYRRLRAQGPIGFRRPGRHDDYGDAPFQGNDRLSQVPDKEDAVNSLNWVLAACAAAGIGMSGCFKEKREYALNPDGSGKVTVEMRQPMMSFDGEEKPDPRRKALKAAGRIVSDSQGVDAWRSVSFSAEGNDTLVFKGTAYFRDVNRLKFAATADVGLAVSWKPQGAGYVLELGKAEKSRPKEPPPSDAEAAQRAQTMRSQFKKQLPMMGAMLNEFRSEWVFALPGAPERMTNFQKEAGQANGVTAVFDGPKILEALGKLADDEAFWKAHAASGAGAQDGPEGDVLNGLLFGTRGPIQAVIGAGTKPLFDYAAETAAARASQQAMLEAIGLAAQAPAPPAAGGAFKQLRVVGARLVTESDGERDIRPFQQDKGFSLALFGELPGSVLTIKKAALTSAVADTGENLLPDNEWRRRINFPRLTKDKTGVTLDCVLLPPPAGARGLRELSGTLTYTVAAGEKEVALGLMALKSGAEGKALDARISKTGKSQWPQGASELTLRLVVDHAAVKSVRFLDAHKAEIALKPHGSFSSNDECSLTFQCPGDLPAEAEVVVLLHDNLKDFTLSFKIENVDLLGRPMK